MIQWWENRYHYLEAYSVFPWEGEQCTTTVKSALQNAYPFDLLKGNKNQIQDDTQTPNGLLKELNYFISTSRNRFNETAKDTIIKNEAADFNGN